LLAAAREYELGPDVLALPVVVDQPWADVVLSGAATSEQLHSNLAALQVVVDHRLQQRLRKLVESPEQYWSERARQSWA
jgi:aryl-alcohol dehydrogenase-like predicted oxidoreductase